MPSLRQHWDRTYEEKGAESVSWYTPHLETSLQLVGEAAKPQSTVIDVGGGASTLVEDLLLSGFAHVTVLDLSERALELARRRVEQRSDLDERRVDWMTGDVTTVPLSEAAYDVWHDRAVLHFLTEEADREAYARQLRRALRPGGIVVIGAFALDGPERCSGLPVRRYDAQMLQDLLGDEFTLERTLPTEHQTPAGRPQRFINCRFRRAE